MLKISEHELHIACVNWFELQHGNSGAILNHCPNEGLGGDTKDLKNRLVRYNTKMKNLGRKAGFPDIEILHNGKVLFIELKTQKGTLSQTQKTLFDKMQKTGFQVHIVRTLDEFMNTVNNFIKIYA